jgi:hypothetical protein
VRHAEAINSAQLSGNEGAAFGSPFGFGNCYSGKLNGPSRDRLGSWVRQPSAAIASRPASVIRALATAISLLPARTFSAFESPFFGISVLGGTLRK